MDQAQQEFLKIYKNKFIDFHGLVLQLKLQSFSNNPEAAKLE